METKPNIIFISCHDLGQHLGCYGQDSVTSPNLDQLASEGVLFKKSFCTAPLCSPSRAAFITGRYPHSTGVMQLAHGSFKGVFNPDEQPLPLLLKEKGGYETHLFGLQHATSDITIYKYTRIHNSFPPISGNYDCRDVAESFEEFLKNRDNGGHFYAEIGLFEPHRPFEHGGIGPNYEKGVKVPPYLADTPLSREQFGMYQGAIRKVDTSIGRMLNSVKEYCDMNNTWIIFTVDHGSPFPFAKTTLYDPGLQTALLMRYDGQYIKGGKMYDTMISNVDLVPTILEGVGINLHNRIQGRSFWNLMTGQEYEKRTEIFAEKTYHAIYDPKRAIRTERYKLILNFENIQIYKNNPDKDELQMGIETHPKFNEFRNFIELYDLKDDPLERNDLAGRKEYEQIERDLILKIRNWMEETKDPLLNGPVPSPAYLERINELILI